MRYSKSMRKSMRRSKSMRKSMSQSKKMRGGDGYNSNFSTNITGSSDNATPLTSVSGLSAQDDDRVALDTIQGEGPPANLSGYQQPPPFTGTLMGGSRRSRSRKMRYSKRQRGGNEHDMAMSTASPSTSTSSPAMTTGGRRRRARSKNGGGIISTAAVPFGLWGLQRMFSRKSGHSKKNRMRRQMGGEHVKGSEDSTGTENDAGDFTKGDSNISQMTGGDDMVDYLPDSKPTLGNHAPDTSDHTIPVVGGRRRTARRSKNGGGIISTAAVPFGLWGLQRMLSGKGTQSMKTRRNRRRRM
jgi:hypothetical protein